MSWRKARIYLRSRLFRRNLAISLAVLSLVLATGHQAKRSLAKAIYLGMVYAHEHPEP